MRDLLVDASAFPMVWEPSDSARDPSPIPEKALVEDYCAEQGFSQRLLALGVDIPEGVSAWHRVFRYRNKWQATEAFYLDYPRGFHASSRLTSWEEPESWSYRSLISDRFRFACADFDTIHGLETHCTAMAQYDEFVSVFSTDALPEAMTLDDLERALRFIDERMERHLRASP